jgi:hypothetical protein
MRHHITVKPPPEPTPYYTVDASAILSAYHQAAYIDSRSQLRCWNEAVKDVLRTARLVSGHSVLKGRSAAPAGSTVARDLRRLYYHVPEYRRHELLSALLELAEDLRAKGLVGLAASTALRNWCDHTHKELNS